MNVHDVFVSRVLLWGAGLTVLATSVLPVETCSACTVGVAHGIAATDGRPILWKTRDADEARQQLVRVTGPLFSYIAVKDEGGSVYQGLNDAGLASGNSLVDTPGGAASNSSPQRYALADCSSVDQVRSYFAAQIASGTGNSSGCFPFIDANGNAIVLEINRSEWMLEYNAVDPDRSAQGLSGIVVRANEFHQRQDGTDDITITGGRYESGTYNIKGLMNAGMLSPTTMLSGNAGATGYEFARYGPGRSLATISRSITRSAMVVHGVMPGENPELATMWAVLGQPNYGVAVPAWVAVADIPSSLAEGSMYDRAQSLYSKGDEALTQTSTLPFETYVYDQVEELLGHWRSLASTPVSDMSRVENRIAEDAYSIMSCLDLTKDDNQAPCFLGSLETFGVGLTLEFSASASDPDGAITDYEWNFGDGSTSTEVSPWHAFPDTGTYLVSCTVTDNWDVSNTAWMYYEVMREPGDYDGNGSVGPEDFSVWKAHFGTGYAPADGNSDGIVDAADYTVWRDNLVVPEPGDYDGNGSVGPEDFNVWKEHFGTNYAPADGNRDGVVDAADYTVWRDNLGAGSGSLASISVPEPAGAVLWITGVVFLQLARGSWGRKYSPARSWSWGSLGAARGAGRVIVASNGVVLVLFAFLTQTYACTLGVASGHVTTNGRALLWRNADSEDPRPVILTHVSASPFDYLGVRTEGSGIYSGLNDAGVALTNATVSSPPGPDPGPSPYLYVLKNCSNLGQIRVFLQDEVNAGTCYLSGNFPFIDAQGNASVFEIERSRWLLEYDSMDPDRQSQGLYGLVVRANEFHEQPDGTDDTTIAGRYQSGTYNASGLAAMDMLSPKTIVQGNSGSTGYEFARYGPGRSLSSIARSGSYTTVSTMAVEGVAPGEDPALTTLWVVLGQPNYGIAVPAWVKVSDVPPSLGTSDMYDRAMSLHGKGAETVTQASVFPLESHLFSEVDKLLDHWRQEGVPSVTEITRIEHQMAEDAYSLLSCLDLAKDDNQAPYLGSPETSGLGLTLEFSASASDLDGTIADYDWNFGDGSTSTEPSPWHTFSHPGTYLVSCTVTDNWDVSNTAWVYYDVAPVPGDYDGNGSVGPEDFNVWKANFGTGYAAADGNGDGIVDAADYTVWRDNLVPEPGDYDGNGSVGPEDFDVWKANFGTSYAAADGNGDGVVDAADYTVWRDNLTAGSGSLASVAVPEPTGAVLWIIGVIFLQLRRRTG